MECWFSGAGDFEFGWNCGLMCQENIDFGRTSSFRGPGPRAWGPRPGASEFRTDILKLKELSNDVFETSRCALWLGIRTFVGFNIHYPKPQGS